MAESESWTVKALLDWTTEFFTKRNIESPRLATEVLLADCLEIPRIELYVRFDQEVDAETRARFKDRMKRHALGEPVAYLVGYREFYSLTFDVTSDVLIPRPETENLVGETLDRFTSRKSEVLKIVDVGTGSGIIAVCLARFLKKSEVTALDKSSAALKVAAANAEKHGVSDRISFVESDLLSSVPDGELFDLVVSNPPYVSQEELKTVSESVKKFEPMMALDGLGEDGSVTSRRLIEQAAGYLKPGGWLLLESSPMLCEKLSGFILEQAGWKSSLVIKDDAGLDRIVAAQRC